MVENHTQPHIAARLILSMNESLISELEQTLRQEMPICEAMEISVASWDKALVDGGRLAMRMPLRPNRNHQSTAFAGSLNALCTIAGWGTMFLLLRQQGLDGNIVIRRSKIRFHRPVCTDEIIARGEPLDDDDIGYFCELLQSKGTSKLDVTVKIADGQGPLVTFSGSYVVQR